MIERPAVRALEAILADLNNVAGDEKSVVTNLSIGEVLSNTWNVFLFGTPEEENEVVIERWSDVYVNIVGSAGIAIMVVLIAISVAWDLSWLRLVTMLVAVPSALANLLHSVARLQSRKRTRGRKSRPDS